MCKRNGKNSVGSETSVHRQLGDSAYYISLAGTISFAFCVIKFMNSESSLFDEQWKKDGFCVTNADVPYFSSHDVCLYLDLASAIVLGLVYLALRKTPGMESANEMFLPGVAGILAHGLGHGALGKYMRDGVVTESTIDRLGIGVLMETSWKEALLSQVPFLFFWLGLLKASMPNIRMGLIGIFSAFSLIGNLFISTQFGFTYVQTVLLFAFSINQLARDSKEKNFVYAIYPLIVSIPLIFVGWMESTQCSAFVKDKFYGHVVYDGFIPASVLVWYLMSYIHASSKEKTA